MEPDVATPEEENEEEDAISQEGGVVTVSAGTRYGEKDPETNERPKVEVSVSYIPGDDLTSAVEMYGEEVVYDRYRRAADRDLSNAIRSAENKHLNAGVDPEQVPDLVREELSDWRPDLERRAARRTPEENILANFNTLPAEKQAEILARLQAAQQPQGTEA